MLQKVTIDLVQFQLEAEIFDTEIGRKFVANLPYTINEVETWGEEIYGAIKVNLGKEKSQSSIPKGGLAYSSKGSYFCIFYGQTPAWPVEHIGQILNDGWKKLSGATIDQIKIGFNKG